MILVRNNQCCHVKYWCNLSSKAGWKSDMCAEIQISGFHEPAVIALWAKTCGMDDRRKMNSHHVLKSTTICPKQQSHSEKKKKKDIKLNVRWIMHVRGKTRLYRYLSDWLVLWQWGSISAPSLTLHSLLLSWRSLIFRCKKKSTFFPHLTLPSSRQAGCILHWSSRRQLWTYNDPCLQCVTISFSYKLWIH